MKLLCSLALVLCCGLTSFAQSPVVTFEAEDIIADSSTTVSTITVSAAVDTGTASMEGHTLAFQWDPDVLSVVSLVDVLPFTPSFHALYFYNFDTTDPVNGDVYQAGTAGSGALYSFGLNNTVPLGQTPVPILQFTVYAQPGVPPGTTSEIALFDGFDAPGNFTWFNSLVWKDAGNNSATDHILLPPLPFTTLSLVEPTTNFQRGDHNLDGTANLIDAIFLLDYGFAGGPAPQCWATVDVYADGLDSVLEETIRTLEALFIPNAPIASVGCVSEVLDPSLTCDDESACP